MSENSHNLSLPFIQPSQAQKHVTHNEALRLLDAVVQLTLQSLSQQTPPSLATDGQVYALPAGANGAWAGQAGQLAMRQDGAWVFVAPQPGWRAWVADQAALHVFHDGSWQPATTEQQLQNLPHIGVGTTAEGANSLAVAGQASLFSHAGGGHQLKLNKASSADTASVLFQTDWAGRAEFGCVGNDDFTLKTSVDGQAFTTAMVVDGASGQVRFPQGVQGLARPEFGGTDLATTTYVKALADNLIVNGNGAMGTSYNMPAPFGFDPGMSPGGWGSFVYTGYFTESMELQENTSLDPTQCYILSCDLRQEGVAQDTSMFANGDRHMQMLGLNFFDCDGHAILATHHARFKQSGLDSLTSLAAPLAPGDTVVQLTDASGWNESSTNPSNRGIIIFGYRNAAGALYRHYSRIVELDIFDLGQIDKTTGTLTLNKPLPASMANPDDPSGIWPVGTPLANTQTGNSMKFSFFPITYLPQSNRWYRYENYICGVDQSGTNAARNFPPGTASVVPIILPNYSNRAGGIAGHPDTGPSQRLWVANLGIQRHPYAPQRRIDSGPQAGAIEFKVIRPDFDATSIVPQAPDLHITPLED